MKNIIVPAFVALLAVSPVHADPSTEGDVKEGMSLMEQGANLLMRGLLNEMEPALKDLKGLAEEMAPAFIELQGMIGDFTNFHAPEVLPNGDIILRRKTPIEAVPEGEIEI